jgi:hypothetical protein
MARLMDLVAGDAREVLLAIGAGDVAGLEDRGRFVAQLALGGGLDPTWLDLFAEAARTVVGGDGPGDFLDARVDLPGGEVDERYTVERVDPGWVEAVARIPAARIGAVASAWIELIEEDLGPLPREEKPWIRDLAGRLVAFCRDALDAPDVLFAWSTP